MSGATVFQLEDQPGYTAHRDDAGRGRRGTAVIGHGAERPRLDTRYSETLLLHIKFPGLPVWLPDLVDRR